jgi:phosphatidate cytidylyltransferase
MTNLAKRVVTAFFLVAAVLLALYVLPAPSAILLFGFFMVVGAWEWGGFIDGARPLTRILYVTMLMLIAWMPFYNSSLPTAISLSMYMAVIYWIGVFVILFRSDDQLTSVTTAVAGALALIPAWFALVLLISDGYGPEYFVWCVSIVAAADIGAYFTGKKFGKRKLAPSISPGKTQEGLAGGVIAASIVSAAAGFFLGGPVWLFFLAGALIALVSVGGDLWVSRFKRAANLKDSGSILPGHGGIMDRIDSLIAGLPFFALVVVYTIGGSNSW